MKHGSQRATQDILNRARGEFARWRSGRPVGARIPDRLWRTAMEAGRECGVSKTSRELGLDYYGLKRRVTALGEESASGKERSGAHGSVGRDFVELPLWAPAGSPTCVIELEDGRGARLRVELTGVPRAELETLAGALWRAAR